MEGERRGYLQSCVPAGLPDFMRMLFCVIRRVTTSCFRLLTAHDFECCCTSFDVYGINEVSTVMAGTSSQMLFNILLISQWDKSHTFQGFSVQK